MGLFGQSTFRVFTPLFDPIVRFVLIGGVEISRGLLLRWLLVHAAVLGPLLGDPVGRRGAGGPDHFDIWSDYSIRGTLHVVSKEGTVDNDALLRRHGLHVTAQRLAVLRAVSDGPHRAADDVYNVVRAGIGAISRQAVYDALGALTQKGLVRRIQPAGSPARYEARVGDNHHHLICRSCGRMVDVDCAVGETPCLTASDDSGYEIDEAEVIYWGRCPECLAPSAVDHHKEPSERGARRT